MSGQAGGGSMWSQISGASGGPPVSAYGMPGFNGVYPGLVPNPAAHAASHLGNPFVQPHPYPQPTSSMMQRQLGNSHLIGMPSSRGHPSAPNSMASMMLPPSSTNPRNVELQERKRQEAERRKREEAERQKVEKAEKDFWKSSLFEEPTKVASGESNQVANVLGNFDSSAIKAINRMDNIGVDYQPPTPAPIQHIIGEEDDMPAAKPITPANALYGHHASMGMQRNPTIPFRKPPSGTIPGLPSNGRLPENINQVYPPTSRPSSNHRGPQRSPMEPPNLPPNAARPDHTFREPISSIMAAPNSRLVDKRRQIPPLNLNPKTNEQDINNIFKEMINPLNPGGNSDSNSVMPPPLSAIYTPKVTKHEGNKLPSVPKYSFGTLPVSVSPPPSPIKPINHSPERTPSAIQANSRPVKNDIIHAQIPGSFTNPTLSEESESERELPNSSMTFDPRVGTIEKKPPTPSNSTATSGSASKANHTSSESSESDESTSDESSSDDESKTRKQPQTSTAKSTAPGSGNSRSTSQNPVESETDGGNRNPEDPSDYSLETLFTKARTKQSPGSMNQSQSTPFAPEELLSQERSPLPFAMILGASEDKIMDISKPVSPLPGSPPSSSSCSGRKTRRARHTTSRPSKTLVESSDEDITESIPSRKPPTKKTPPKPRKNALPNKVMPNTVSLEDDDLSESHFPSSKKKRPKTVKQQQQPPAASAIQQQPPKSLVPSSSGAESEDDEDKDTTFKVYNQNISTNNRSPRKRKVPKNETVDQMSTTSTASNISNQQQQQPTPTKEESKTQKRSIFKRIFPHPQKEIKAEKENALVSPKAKQEPLEATAILKRTDGRPILICKIPFSILQDKTSKKRERKTSTSSTASAASKKSKKLEDVKPEATILENLPGYGGPSGSTTSSSLRNLMPPPPDQKVEATEEHPQHPQTQSHNLYPNPVEDEFQVYMTQAKKLKHEADKDSNNRERQAMKYLEAVLFFILCGSTTETRGDHAAAYTMYKETLYLVRHVSRPLRSSSSEYANITDNKLAILSYRCQSLLYLKLYKLRKNELKECQQKLEDLLNNASKNGLNSPVGNGGSPTPSPAGSEGSVCSKSSGYTSSGELPMTSKYVGVLTPPSSNPCNVGGTMSVPHTLMQKQYNYSNYLTQCHELWEMAEVHIIKGHCSDFIAHLDQTYGMLTLHSSLKDLVKYTQAGLDFLAKERENIQRARRL